MLNAAQGWRLRTRTAGAPAATPHDVAMPLRTGVERAMVATLAVAGPLLVLQSMPEFAAERMPGAPLVPVSLLLVLLPCLLVPLGLLRPRTPAYRWLLVSALAHLGLAVLERFEVRPRIEQDVMPWLAGLCCVAFTCLAIGLPRALHAGVASAVLIGAVTLADAGRTPAAHLVIDAAGLAALTAGLIAGVRASRRRSDRADEAHRAAHDRFDSARRAVALEEERIRTDALLHDSVLTTLLIAAAGQGSPERAVLMAHNALAVVSMTQRAPEDRSSTQTFQRAVAGAEQELAALGGRVRLDLYAGGAVELPAVVADTLVSAMVQALSNSVKHAGPVAVRSATAEPTGQGGLVITVRDDGRGFDLDAIAPERLGVRVSIIERMRLIGGRADIRSAAGSGTTVLLEWQPQQAAAATELRSAVLA